MMELGSPWWRIAAATGEEPAFVATAIQQLGLRGYDADDIWTLLKGALNANMTMADLLEVVGDKT